MTEVWINPKDKGTRYFGEFKKDYVFAGFNVDGVICGMRMPFKAWAQVGRVFKKAGFKKEIIE